MGKSNRRRYLVLVPLAAVSLLRPFPVFADELDGLPSPPTVNNGTEGKIEDVTFNGRTFKQGRQVVSSSDSKTVSVDVDIYTPEGVGPVLNSQRRTTIQYRWNLASNAADDGKELTESITVKSTLENRDTGTTTEELYGGYTVNTDWERALGTYALRWFEARALSTRDPDVSIAHFYKNIHYSNKRTDDGNFF